VAIVVTAAVLIAACSEGGDQAATTSSSTTEVSTGPSGDSSTTTTTGDTTTEPPAAMPDLVGETENEARSTLLGLGIAASDVFVEERESLEAAGTVIETVPSAGGRITGSVNLLVAVPVGDVPDFAGEPISVVREWAEQRGVTVTEDPVPDDTAPEGQVIETTPGAGQTATSEIVVRYATNPLVVPLPDIPYTNDLYYCYSADFGIEASVNGEFQQDSIAIEPDDDSSTPCVIEYNLGRDWTRLKATVGVEDSSDTDVRYRVQIVGDDNELWNHEVLFAQTQDLDVDMTNVLRLQIVVTTLVPDLDGRAVLGNIRLIGDEDVVPSTTSTTA
jgi:NPCBM/NEW2 domain/PASTA domain